MHQCDEKDAIMTDLSKPVAGYVKDQDGIVITFELDLIGEFYEGLYGQGTYEGLYGQGTIDALVGYIRHLRSTLYVNAIAMYPDKTHEQLQIELDRICPIPPSVKPLVLPCNTPPEPPAGPPCRTLRY